MRKILTMLALGAAGLATLCWSARARAQASTTQKEPRAEVAEAPETWGAVEPGKGFEVAKTKLGTLDISAYALFRYINQLPANQTLVDHLGRPREIHMRNDLQLHRVQIFVKGWLFDPKMHYVMQVWTVNTTGQVAVVGNMSYSFAKAFNLYAGVNGIPGTRSLGGSHPYWLAPDRVMADEFFRPGFSSGVWATGEPLPTFHYTVMVGTNLSQLGISAGEDTRDLAYAATIWWMPTTGEFGPRGAFGDFEGHSTVATRFGFSSAFSREDRFSQLSQRSPDNTSIRISDSLNLFETGTLADGVTMQKANYLLFAADLGLKYKGLFLQTELYHRRLDKFSADGPLPLNQIRDSGFYVQSSFMVLPRLLELYASTSWVFGQFNNAWEVLGGTNCYPFDDRNFRLNLQVIRIERSPVNSSFGYYVGGQRGTTISVASSILF